MKGELLVVLTGVAVALVLALEPPNAPNSGECQGAGDQTQILRQVQPPAMQRMRNAQSDAVGGRNRTDNQEIVHQRTRVSGVEPSMDAGPRLESGMLEISAD